MTASSLADIRPIVQKITDWCVEQPDVTGFALQLVQGGGSSEERRALSIKLNFKDLYIESRLTIAAIEHAQIDIVTVNLDEMVRKARAGISKEEQILAKLREEMDSDPTKTERIQRIG